MTHLEIVATYSDTTLKGVIKSLSFKSAWWPERLEAALKEQAKRKLQNLQKNQLSKNTHS